MNTSPVVSRGNVKDICKQLSGADASLTASKAMLLKKLGDLAAILVFQTATVLRCWRCSTSEGMDVKPGRAGLS